MRLALFFTKGVSLKQWHDIGMIDREVAIYNKLSTFYDQIYFFTYGGAEDLSYSHYLAKNVIIVPKKLIKSNIIYSILLPLIHRRILKDIDVFKTNQMWGAWSAVIAKAIFKKKLIVRTGYTLSLFAIEGRNNRSSKLLYSLIEKIAYRMADGIITSSKKDNDYIAKKYHPSGDRICLPNYIDTSLFCPTGTPKVNGSICFVGRLSEQKNLAALLDSLSGLGYNLTIVGSGPQEKMLADLARESKISVTFMGNVPNNDLPAILNGQEIFILPSFYEGMPKTLLEAMSCGMPVIGTNVSGINEVIEHGKNGYLCNTDAISIRTAIINIMNDEEMRVKLGERARATIMEHYDLKNVISREIEFTKIVCSGNGSTLK